jgi:hypothetical protein
MQAEFRPVTMWAINYGNGHIDRHSVRPTRAQAIDAFCSDPAAPRWDYWHRRGCRAVKVRLVVLPDGGEVGNAS